MIKPRLKAEDYTVGWVSALPLELAAATQMLNEEHEDLPQDPADPSIYTLGRIGEHNVVIVCLPAGQIGTHPAAAAATRMSMRFRSIQFGLMVGIAGGVPSAADVRLGDVVVSQPNMEHGGVVQYDFGKSMPQGFVPKGVLNPPPTLLLNALTKIQAMHMRGKSKLPLYLAAFDGVPSFSRDRTGPDLLFQAEYRHVGDRPTCDLCERERLVEREPRDVMVHYGLIASGNRVMRDATERDNVSEGLGGVLAFEMEAAGLMNNFPCLVIRGICDYADSHKNKGWQHFAAATASAYAKEILSVIPEADVVGLPTIRQRIRPRQSEPDGDDDTIDGDEPSTPRVIFSGSNNKGFQLGVNYGSLSGLSFGNARDETKRPKRYGE